MYIMLIVATLVLRIVECQPNVILQFYLLIVLDRYAEHERG